MAVPVISFSVTFLHDIDGTTKLILVGTTDYVAAGIALADVKEAVEVISPSGVTFKVADLSLPDIDPTVTREYRIPLPTTGQEVQEGDYQVKLYSRVTGSVDSGDYESNYITVNFCGDYPELCLKYEIDCIYMVLTANDTTQWAENGWTIGSRLLTLSYPVGANHANITSAGPSITTSGNDLYSGTFGLVAEWTVTKGAVTHNLRKPISIPVDCPDSSLCTMLCCLKSVYELTLSKNVGTMTEANRKFAEMSNLMNYIQAAAKCGDKANMDTLLDKFYSIGGCTDNCGCGCSDTDGPQLLYPIHPGMGGGNTTYTFLDDGLVEVNVNGTTITYSLSASVQSLLAAITLYNVTSTDGSITITPTTAVGSPGTTTFDLSAASPAPDSLTFIETWDPSTGLAARSSPQVIGDSFDGGTVTVTATGAGFWNVTNFWAAGVTPSAFYARVTLFAFNLKYPYSNTARYDSIVAPWVTAFNTVGNTGFAMGLGHNSSLIPGNIGATYQLSAYAPYLNSLSVMIEIIKQ